jgi:LAS superfamily LD-carboxypeptidase LdcB
VLTWQQACGIDESHLTEISQNGSQSRLANIQVIKDLNTLLDSAKQQGHEITIISSFRSFERQLAIWNDKWMGHRPVFSRHGRPLNIDNMSDIERYKAIALWSALPGLSRHHWGTDFDIFSAHALKQGYQVELTPEEFSEKGICCELEKWLSENLSQYGFFRPYKNYNQGVAEEPWHISHKLTSTQIFETFDYKACKTHLASSEIKAKDFILDKLEHYQTQYFENFETE